jgi:polyisoprenoid-binding protein YceI
MFLPLVACSEDLTEGRPAAAPAPPAPPPAAAAPAGAPASPGHRFDPARSTLSVKASKVTRTHDIQFGSFSGSFTLEGERVSRVEVAVAVASLKADVEKLTQHLLSPDFLDVAQFAEATFRGEVKADSAEGTRINAVASGPLTLHGVEKAVSIPVRIDLTAAEVTGEADFTINRQDFGVTYPGKPDDLIRDDVAIHLVAVAARQPG